MKWFRSYHGAPMDTKWLAIARKTGVAPSVVAVTWWCLEDHASRQAERGSIEGFDADEVAAFFQCEQTDIEAVLGALQDKGCTSGNRIANWEEYQPVETSTKRVQAYRQRRETVPKQAETESNENLSLSKSKSSSQDEMKKDFECWYARYPRRTARGAALKAYRVARQKASAETLLAGVERYLALKPDYADWMQPASWLNAERWLDEPDQRQAKPTNGANGHDTRDPMTELRMKAQAMAKGGPRMSSVTDRQLAEAVRQGWLPRARMVAFVGEAITAELAGASLSA